MTFGLSWLVAGVAWGVGWVVAGVVSHSKCVLYTINSSLCHVHHLLSSLLTISIQSLLHNSKPLETVMFNMKELETCWRKLAFSSRDSWAWPESSDWVAFESCSLAAWAALCAACIACSVAASAWASVCPALNDCSDILICLCFVGWCKLHLFCFVGFCFALMYLD